MPPTAPMFGKPNGKWQAPFLEIPAAQLEQLKAVRDALKTIPVTPDPTATQPKNDKQ